jgi:hypothetical protein
MILPKKKKLSYTPPHGWVECSSSYWSYKSTVYIVVEIEPRCRTGKGGIPNQRRSKVGVIIGAIEVFS